MIGYISCIISFILCAVFYTKMVRLEEPITLDYLFGLNDN